jgi:cytochrome d ubiquinol oxidase subunit I|tara:strand:- start:3226 stop:3357 length:132 start_codon:yes stop_codon:yes gene_type:complete
MMNKPAGTLDDALKDGPIRTAGITPIMQTDPGSIPANKDLSNV